MASSLRTFTSSLRLALPLARPTSARSGFRPIPSGPSSSRWASTSADVNNHGPYLTLGELANNKGATKTVSRIFEICERFLSLELSGNWIYSTYDWDEDGHPRKVELQDGDTRVRRLERVMESQRPASKEVRLLSLDYSPSEASTTCEHCHRVGSDAHVS